MLQELTMAQRQNRPVVGSTNGGGKTFPPEAYNYADDVTADTVAKVRAEYGVDVSNEEEWETVDGLGQVVHA
jgi:hypothetical protein